MKLAWLPVSEMSSSSSARRTRSSAATGSGSSANVCSGGLEGGRRSDDGLGGWKGGGCEGEQDGSVSGSSQDASSEVRISACDRLLSAVDSDRVSGYPPVPLRASTDAPRMRASSSSRMRLSGWTTSRPNSAAAWKCLRWYVLDRNALSARPQVALACSSHVLSRSALVSTAMADSGGVSGLGGTRSPTQPTATASATAPVS